MIMSEEERKEVKQKWDIIFNSFSKEQQEIITSQIETLVMCERNKIITGSIDIGDDLILFQGETIEEAIEDLRKMYNFHFHL